jgi:hypothetical protein
VVHIPLAMVHGWAAADQLQKLHNAQMTPEATPSRSTGPGITLLGQDAVCTELLQPAVHTHGHTHTRVQPAVAGHKVRTPSGECKHTIHTSAVTHSCWYTQYMLAVMHHGWQRTHT